MTAQGVKAGSRPVLDREPAPGSSPLRYQPVVPATEQDQVVEGRRTAVRPMFEVVGVRPRRRAVTAGKPAAFVPGAQCTPRRAGTTRLVLSASPSMVA